MRKITINTNLEEYSQRFWKIEQDTHSLCVCVLVAQLCPTFFTPWTVAWAPLAMEFSRRVLEWVFQGIFYSGSFDPRVEPGSPALRTVSLPFETPGREENKGIHKNLIYL